MEGSLEREELEAQLARLGERSGALDEGSKGPRGSLPALFRALGGVERSVQEGAVGRLVGWWADPQLAGPILEWVEGAGLGGVWWEEVGSAESVWVALDQAQAVGRVGGERGLEVLRVLWEGVGDPTELAVALDPEAFVGLLLEVLRLRLTSRGERRDRVSARLSCGALRALMQVAPDDWRVQEAARRVVVAETRRAGKGEPTLALEALEALSGAPPIPQIRLFDALLRGIDRRKVVTRIQEALDGAVEAAGASADDVAELTSRRGGLERDGWGRLALDEGEEARFRPGLDGGVERVVTAALDRDDERALERAEQELLDARRELARRLEGAMVSRRVWEPGLWRAIFFGHPLWRDLAGRVIWERRGDEGVQAFTSEDGVGSDLFGDPVEFGAGDRVGVWHPVGGGEEEVELWRDRRWEGREGPQAPFLQAFRPVEATGAGDLQGYVGREAYRETLGELARRSGWRGLPLVGEPPWPVEREFGCGLRVELELEAVVPPAPKRVVGKRGAAARSQLKAAAAKPEAAPRVRVAEVRVVGGTEGVEAAVALAEARWDLAWLTDPLAAPSDIELRGWQQTKWKDPAASWKEVVLRYRKASGALAQQRKFLLERLSGGALRLEDRFAITQEHVIEVGTGLVHAGHAKDHVPLWKADELAAEAGLEAVSLPFERRLDPEGVAVLERVLGLAARAASGTE